MEHILLTERLVLSLLGRPSDRKMTEGDGIGFEKLDRIIVKLRERKIMAPDMLQPKGTIKSAEAFKELFLRQREILKENLRSGKIVIDDRLHKHPVLGEMTIADWLNFIPLHTRRHLEQIKDLRARINK